MKIKDPGIKRWLALVIAASLVVGLGSTADFSGSKGNIKAAGSEYAAEESEDASEEDALSETPDIGDDGSDATSEEAVVTAEDGSDATSEEVGGTAEDGSDATSVTADDTAEDNEDKDASVDTEDGEDYATDESDEADGLDGSTLDTLETYDAASDADAYDESDIIIEDETSIDMSSLDDNDELFEEYLNRMIYGDSGIATVANWGLTRFDGDEHALALYEVLKNDVCSVAAGETSSTKFENISEVTWTYTYDELGFDEPVSNVMDLYNAAVEKSDLTNTYYNVSRVLMVDYPYEFYWYDKTQGTNRAYKYDSSPVMTSDGMVYTTISLYYVWIYFPVCEEFRVSSANIYSFDTSYVTTAQASIANADAIVEKYADLSDYEKLRGYKNEICKLNTYNYDAAYADDMAYGNPWQLIWVFDGDPDTNVVCEGYSKAFQYLCDKSTFTGDVVCYTVTGYLGNHTGEIGGHMWNIVHIDGENYLMDATNCDGKSNSNGYDDSLFLVAPFYGEYTGQYRFHYNYTTDSNYLYYEYYDTTFKTYDESVLKLAEADYDPPIVDAKLSLSDEGYIYDGTAKTPEVTVRNPTTGTVLTENHDYILNYKNNTAAGTASVTVSYIGDYVSQGSETFEFEIKKAEIGATLGGTAEKVYDGTTGVEDGDLYIELTGAATGDDVAATADFSYESADVGSEIPINVSDVELVGSAAGNYVLNETEFSTTGSITAKDIASGDISISEIGNQYYTGAAIKPPVAVEDAGVGTTLGEDVDYTVSYGYNTDVGTGSVKISGTGNYAGETTVTFDIEYISAPEYGLSGDADESGWYTSDVEISAPGWSVSEDGVSWSGSLTVSNDGSNSVTLYFKEDGTGYRTGAVTASLNIDHKGPEFSSASNGIRIKEGTWYQKLLSVITFGRYYNDDSVTVTINATDEVSGIAAYYYYVDTSGSATAKTAAELADESFTEANGSSFDLAAEGDYVVYAYAVDNAGNMSDYISSDGFIIDRTPMSLSGVNVVAGETYAYACLTADEAGTIYYLVTDGEVSGIDAEYVMEYGSETASDGAGNVNIELADLEDGHAYLVYLVSVDTAGNVSECAGYAFETNAIVDDGDDGDIVEDDNVDNGYDVSVGEVGYVEDVDNGNDGTGSEDGNGEDVDNGNDGTGGEKGDGENVDNGTGSENGGDGSIVEGGGGDESDGSTVDGNGDGSGGDESDENVDDGNDSTGGDENDGSTVDGNDDSTGGDDSDGSTVDGNDNSTGGDESDGSTVDGNDDSTGGDESDENIDDENDGSRDDEDIDDGNGGTDDSKDDENISDGNDDEDDDNTYIAGDVAEEEDDESATEDDGSGSDEDEAAADPEAVTVTGESSSGSVSTGDVYHAFVWVMLIFISIDTIVLVARRRRKYLRRG